MSTTPQKDTGKLVSTKLTYYRCENKCKLYNFVLDKRVAAVAIFSVMEVIRHSEMWLASTTTGVLSLRVDVKKAYAESY